MTRVGLGLFYLRCYPWDISWKASHMYRSLTAPFFKTMILNTPIATVMASPTRKLVVDWKNRVDHRGEDLTRALPEMDFQVLNNGNTPAFDTFRGYTHVYQPRQHHGLLKKKIKKKTCVRNLNLCVCK